MDAVEIRTWPWTEIPGCPGRSILRSPERAAELSRWLAAHERARVFAVAGAQDPVVVLPFDDGGGLISYQKPDGRHVHTLNTPEGFRRKLGQLGITP